MTGSFERSFLGSVSLLLVSEDLESGPDLSQGWLLGGFRWHRFIRYLEALPAAIGGAASTFRYSGRVRVVPLPGRPFILLILH